MVFYAYCEFFQAEDGRAGQMPTPEGQKTPLWEGDKADILNR